MPTKHTPTSFNQLQGKDDIEDDPLEVSKPIARRKSNQNTEPCKEEERFLKRVTQPGDGAIKLPKPGAVPSPVSRPNRLNGPIGPRNNLHSNQQTSAKKKRKIGTTSLNNSSPTNSSGNPPKRQFTEVISQPSMNTEDDDILMTGVRSSSKDTLTLTKSNSFKALRTSCRRKEEIHDLELHIEKIVSSPTTPPPTNPEISKKFPPNIKKPKAAQMHPHLEKQKFLKTGTIESNDTHHDTRSGTKTAAKTSESEKRLEEEVSELELTSNDSRKTVRRSTHGNNSPPNDSNNGWNHSEGTRGFGDPKHTQWSKMGKRKGNKLVSRKKLPQKPNASPLVCVQRGIEAISHQDEDAKNLAIRFHEEGIESEFQVIYGDELNKQLSFKCAAIKSIHLNRSSRKFGVKLQPDCQRDQCDTSAIFIMKDNKGVQAMSETFEDKGFTSNEETEQWFDKLANDLERWRTRMAREHRNPLVKEEPTAADLDLTDYHNEQRRPRKFSELQPVVEVPVRRVTRSHTEAINIEGRPKRSRSLSIDLGTPSRETRSKIRRIELPNPKWERPLIYPFEGPKKETVDYMDLERLNPDEFLNDNLINFYLRYLEVKLHKNNPVLAKETHFLNTFFYERLAKKNENGKRDFATVMKWTAKIDLFKTNYVVMPINEASHWYLAIICNLQHLERKLKRDTIPDSPEDQNHLDPEPNGIWEGVKEGTGFSGGHRSRVVKPTSKEAASDEKDVEVIGTQDSLVKSIDEKDEWPKEDDNQRVDLLTSTPKKGTLNESVQAINIDDVSPENSAGTNKKRAASPKKKHIPPDTPSIIILDSMNFGGSIHPSTIRNLREFLGAEARNKRQLDIEKGEIAATYAKTPSQPNWTDCGLFLLHYVEVFLQRPQEFVAAFLAREDTSLNKEMWSEDKIKGMRERLFGLIVDLHKQYEDHEKSKETIAKNAKNGTKSSEKVAPKQRAVARDREEGLERSARDKHKKSEARGKAAASHTISGGTVQQVSGTPEYETIITVQNSLVNCEAREGSAQPTDKHTQGTKSLKELWEENNL